MPKESNDPARPTSQGIEIKSDPNRKTMLSDSGDTKKKESENKISV